jgi:hypothetical protein
VCPNAKAENRDPNIQHGEKLAAAGFGDDPTKGDLDKLRLELDLVPGWSPGRSMKWPKPAVMRLKAAPLGDEG